jgi:hypothetical protein
MVPAKIILTAALVHLKRDVLLSSAEQWISAYTLKRINATVVYFHARTLRTPQRAKILTISSAQMWENLAKTGHDFSSVLASGSKI